MTMLLMSRAFHNNAHLAEAVSDAAGDGVFAPVVVASFSLSSRHRRLHTSSNSGSLANCAFD
ncbi:hypothetical protein [Salipiger sp. PrR002]|uniref:hypothetical protein n=1 Tax=unclassified Salipiger TaxID=2640570 RepID=UPI0013B82542|nr:hypothetical protein [Salipiger sp. PrR002]NDW02733.1 hypothetical protein [Salipiger sp. PrR002]